jgi:hypothetical protein
MKLKDKSYKVMGFVNLVQDCQCWWTQLRKKFFFNKSTVAPRQFANVPKNCLKFLIRKSWYNTPDNLYKFCHCVWIYSTPQVSSVYLAMWFRLTVDHNGAYCLSSHLQVVSRGTKVLKFVKGMLPCSTTCYITFIIVSSLKIR